MMKFESEKELLNYAQQFAGLNLQQLAERQGLQLPQNNLSGKGWAGLVLELLLGTTAGNQALPDFDYLGIELKTIPVNEQAQPLESTYISLVPLTRFLHLRWENSEIYHKLKRILWVPLVTHKNQPVTERIIGMPFLWSPDAEQSQQLALDWQELMDKVALGELETLSASLGRFLQIRPKGANGQARTRGFNSEGQQQAFLPRGFYLRASFTKQILQSQFQIS